MLASEKAYRVLSEKLDPLPCSDTALELTATSDAVYLVTKKRTLVRGDVVGCSVVTTPRPVTSVGSNGTHLAVTTDLGDVLIRSGTEWRPLPTPMLYRSGSAPRAQAIVQVALSKNAIFGLSDGGYVFMKAIHAP